MRPVLATPAADKITVNSTSGDILVHLPDVCDFGPNLKGMAVYKNTYADNDAVTPF